MGGQLSLFAACDNPSIRACVDFYGIHPNVQPALRDLNAPLLGIFAEYDVYASPEQVNALSEELTLLGKTHEFITFAGKHHAFFNDTGKAYDAEAAGEAWAKVIEFFTNELEA
jgi:carboxymethylenebutenolidase